MTTKKLSKTGRELFEALNGYPPPDPTYERALRKARVEEERLRLKQERDAIYRAWEERDQFDPGCWFRIPDFDARPSKEDNFHGFEGPVIYYWTPELTKPIRGLLATCRRMLRQAQFSNMREVLDANLEALHIVFPVDERQPVALEELSEKQRTALLYELNLWDLQRFQHDGFDKELDARRSIVNLATVADAIAEWALDGSQSAVKRIQKRLEHNREISRRPRPGARSPIRERVIKDLARFKSEGISLIEALKAMRTPTPDGLEAKYLTGGKWEILDGNAEQEPYSQTWGKKALEAMWTEAGIKKKS